MKNSHMISSIRIDDIDLSDSTNRSTALEQLGLVRTLVIDELLERIIAINLSCEKEDAGIVEAEKAIHKLRSSVLLSGIITIIILLMLVPIMAGDYHRLMENPYTIPGLTIFAAFIFAMVTLYYSLLFYKNSRHPKAIASAEKKFYPSLSLQQNIHAKHIRSLQEEKAKLQEKHSFYMKYDSEEDYTLPIFLEHLKEDYTMLFDTVHIPKAASGGSVAADMSDNQETVWTEELTREADAMKFQVDSAYDDALHYIKLRQKIDKLEQEYEFTLYTLRKIYDRLSLLKYRFISCCIIGVVLFSFISMVFQGTTSSVVTLPVAIVILPLLVCIFVIPYILFFLYSLRTLIMHSRGMTAYAKRVAYPSLQLEKEEVSEKLIILEKEIFRLKGLCGDYK